MLSFKVAASVLSGMIRIVFWFLAIICHALTLPRVLITDDIKMSYAMHNLVRIQVLRVFTKLFWRGACRLGWATQRFGRFAALDAPPGIASRAALSLRRANLPHQVSAPFPICLPISISKLHRDKLTFVLLFKLIFQVRLCILQLLW